MPSPLNKPHHPLSESFEGQCDQTEAAAKGQESKDQKRREQARIRAVRYRARKKEKAAQEKEKEELRKRIAQEEKRTRSARYYAKKKTAETMNNSHSANNTNSTDNKNYSNMVKHYITTFFARPHSPSSAAAAAAGNSNYHANSLSTPLHSGRGGRGGATLLSASLAFNPETPVDVLKARVDVTKNLSDIINESAKHRIEELKESRKKHIDEIDDREKKLTHVCQARDAILQQLYNEMKLEQSYLYPPIAQQSSGTTKRNISSSFPAIIDSCEIPRTKMPRVQHISNGTNAYRTGHEDIAVEEDTAMVDAKDNTTHLHDQGGATSNPALPKISSPFPAFHFDGELKFNIGTSGPSSSSNRKKKKVRGNSNYKN